MSSLSSSSSLTISYPSPPKMTPPRRTRGSPRGLPRRQQPPPQLKSSPVVVKTRQKALPSNLKHKRQAKTSTVSPEKIPSVLPETSPNNRDECSNGVFTPDVHNITIGVEQLQQPQEQQLQPLLQQGGERGGNRAEGITVDTLGSVVLSSTKSSRRRAKLNKSFVGKRQRQWQPTGQSPASINSAPTGSLVLNNTMYNNTKHKHKGEYHSCSCRFRVMCLWKVTGQCD